MADEPDGVDEAFESILRVGLTVAGRVGEQLARAREQAARTAQAASEQDARELRNRLTAERAAARAALAPVEDRAWWDNAEPQTVAQAWETARAWQEVDPDARRAAGRICDEVRTRYGVDIDDLQADPAAVREALERRELAERDAQHAQAESARDDAEAARLISDADRADRRDDPQGSAELLEQAGDLYDTAERRRDLAASLEGVADEEAVEARVLADTSQGRPAQEAVTTPPGKAPKARPARGPGGRRKEQQKTINR